MSGISNEIFFFSKVCLKFEFWQSEHCVILPGYPLVSPTLVWGKTECHPCIQVGWQLWQAGLPGSGTGTGLWSTPADKIYELVKYSVRYFLIASLVAKMLNICLSIEKIYICSNWKNHYSYIKVTHKKNIILHMYLFRQNKLFRAFCELSSESMYSIYLYIYLSFIAWPTDQRTK